MLEALKCCPLIILQPWQNRHHSDNHKAATEATDFGIHEGKNERLEKSFRLVSWFFSTGSCADNQLPSHYSSSLLEPRGNKSNFGQ